MKLKVKWSKNSKIPMILSGGFQGRPKELFTALSFGKSGAGYSRNNVFLKRKP